MTKDLSTALMYRPKSDSLYEAIQWDGSTANAYEILAWVHRHGGKGILKSGYPSQGPDLPEILQRDGNWETVITGSFVVRYADGFRVVRKDVFNASFELLNDESS